MHACVKDRCAVKLKSQTGLPLSGLEDFDKALFDAGC